MVVITMQFKQQQKGTHKNHQNILLLNGEGQLLGAAALESVWRADIQDGGHGNRQRHEKDDGHKDAG
jgi:hypothetical protein